MLTKYLMGLMIVFTLAIGCSRQADFGDAEVVLEYIIAADASGAGFSFGYGDFQEGTAVLSGGGLAFWVKDGVGYYVNDAAHAAAPDLARAPDSIQLDGAFRAAAALH